MKKLSSNVNSCFVTMLVLVATLTVLQAQTETGEKPDYWLNEVIVVSDRAESLLRESTTASSVITQAELAKLPVRNLVDALHYVPGLTFVEQDASGQLPSAIVRGFYGGGEAEYILLTIDGVPVNDLRNGLINWNQIPVNDIERIEITRGGGSAMYGDLALGAVINIETRGMRSEKTFTATAKTGQYANGGLDFFYRSAPGKSRFSLRATGDRSDGFRDHSNWRNVDLGGRFDHQLNNTGLVFFRGSFNHLDKDEPGPLTLDAIAVSDRQSTALFSQDNRLRNQLEFGAGYRSPKESNSHLKIDAGIRSLGLEQTRTLQLASEFGDTQFKDETNFSGWGQLQYQRKTGQTQWIAGFDGEYANYSHDYYDAGKTTRFSGGDGSRMKTGVYLEERMALSERVHQTAGVRYDFIKNSSDDLSIEMADVDFSQLSPRIGINLQYLAKEAANGHIYFNWSRAFKAPTLDQLYDSRILDLTDFFGATFNFSNAGLEAQTSSNFDVGIYQQIPLSADGQLFSEVSVSAYLLNIENEIDLDLATFKYGNILKSKHSGVEAALTAYLTQRFRYAGTFNFMNVTFESGDFKGNRLKNIPKNNITNSVNLALNANANITFSHKFFNEVYLDDANTITLPGFHLFDSRLQLSYKQYLFDLSIFNLADKQYNSSGYVLFDAFANQNVQFLYPAQGRFIQGSLSFRL